MVSNLARECEISDNNRKNWMKVEHVQLFYIQLNGRDENCPIFLKYTIQYLQFHLTESI